MVTIVKKKNKKVKFGRIRIGLRDLTVAILPKAGVFIYEGFPDGDYYSSTGDVLKLSRASARIQAEHEGVPFVYQDSRKLPVHDLVIVGAV